MRALDKLSQGGYTVSTGDGYGDCFMNRTAADIMGEWSEQEDEWC